MADTRKLDPGFAAQWGVGELAPAKPEPEKGTRSLDVKEFERQWLTPSAPPAERFDTDNLRSQAAAGLGGFVEGIPIVGPGLNRLTDYAAGGLRTLTHGGSVRQNADKAQRYGKQVKEDFPTTALAGEIGGAVAPMVAAAGIPIAAQTLGLTGTLPARVALGGASNALIGGADAAVRSGGDLAATGTGAGIGGAFGVGAPIVGRGLGAGANWLLQPSRDPVTNRLLAVANREGIPIGAAQASASPWLHKLSQIAGQFPGSGMADFRGEQVSAFTRAVGRTFGEDIDLLTPQVMRRAQRRLGREFDDIAANTTINVDRPFQNALISIAADAESVLPRSELAPIAQQLRNIVEKARTGQISGEQYQALTRKGAPLDRAMHSGDSNVKFYAGEIRDALDEAMQRSATPENAARLANARYQYKNMMTVAPLVERGIPGEVSPLRLQQAVNSSFKGRAFRGGGELGDLGDVGQRFFRQPADSGTPMGNLVVDTLVNHGKLLTGGLLAAGLGGGAYQMGVDPVDIMKTGTLLPMAALAARGTTSVLNQPQSVNRLISRAPVMAPYLNAPTRNMLLPPPEAQPEAR